MAGHRAIITDVEDIRSDGEAVQGMNVTSFPSNIHVGRHFVALNGYEDDVPTEGGVFYVNRAKALELARHFARIAEELGNGVVVVQTQYDINEFYSLAFNDGINSERRSLSRQYREQLKELLEILDTER